MWAAERDLLESNLSNEGDQHCRGRIPGNTLLLLGRVSHSKARHTGERLGHEVPGC